MTSSCWKNTSLAGSGQPAAQHRHQRQRPLGGGGLHDEVAGEPPPVAGRPGALRTGHELLPPPGRRRAGAAEPGADQPPLLALLGRVLDELGRPWGSAAAAPRSSLDGVAAGAAVHGGQHRDLGVVALAAERLWPAPSTGRSRRPPAASPASPAIAASTRGSSWAASATISVQPSSATTTRRITLGICSAPPPLVAHRPDTTPPTTYSARKRPSRTHWSAQVQPWKLYSRASSLYASSGATAGWSSCLSSHDRVVFSATPGPLNALTSCCTESGLTGCAERGRHLVGQRLQLGRPHAVHRARAEQVGEQGVVHVRAPRHAVVAHLGGDQRARRLGRHQQPEPPRLGQRLDPAQLVGQHLGHRLGAQRLGREQRAGLVVGRDRRGTGRPCSLAWAALAERGSPYRPSWASSSPSVSARSWQRPTRRPARSRPG